ncbi:ATP-binding cassette sub-family D member 2 [Gracilariopsis chorda]|uniref:ATP-binding cassette sub-family D member 2 n=1 Tax=Gracilariopsis chorda TaxID=448386 RepID=A0A2V3IFZ9_9FLOR|nr:ATP-binding cassette sub-family D member 2 [Gracilariopsis chorda]|eukprot:PXF41004.1 ATP-binding cassette sub-family D member 2 [Gracilariopsis chorda]
MLIYHNGTIEFCYITVTMDDTLAAVKIPLAKAAVASLSSVELGHLVARCGVINGEMAWDDVLSGGERNRLAVARFLYHKPKFAVSDECTAAISTEREAALYQAMADAKITLLSAAHRYCTAFNDERVSNSGITYTKWNP